MKVYIFQNYRDDQDIVMAFSSMQAGAMELLSLERRHRKNPRLTAEKFLFELQNLKTDWSITPSEVI